MFQGKYYQQDLEKTENKARLIDRFTQYIQKDHIRSNLKRNIVLNSRELTYSINSSELKTLFPFKHEEAETKIVYYCSNPDKPCILKAKDTEILILMFYDYPPQQPEHNWYVQADKDSFVTIGKNYEKLGSTTSLLLPQTHAITGCDTVTYLFNVPKRVMYERASSGITEFNMIIELGSPNIITESVNNGVTKFIQRYVYRGKEV